MLHLENLVCIRGSSICVCKWPLFVSDFVETSVDVLFSKHIGVAFPTDEKVFHYLWLALFFSASMKVSDKTIPAHLYSSVYSKLIGGSAADTRPNVSGGFNTWVMLGAMSSPRTSWKTGGQTSVDAVLSPKTVIPGYRSRIVQRLLIKEIPVINLCSLWLKYRGMTVFRLNSASTTFGGRVYMYMYSQCLKWWAKGGGELSL